MLNKEYLAERIAHHGEIVEAHVLSLHRCLEIGAKDRADESLKIAATHAAIFNALTTIAANKS